MTNLVVFRLHNDSTNDIVATVTRNCCRSLRVLDVQYSQHVDDGAVDEIMMMNKDMPGLEDLGVTGTSIGLEGCTRLLKRFRKTLKRFQVHVAETKILNCLLIQ